MTAAKAEKDGGGAQEQAQESKAAQKGKGGKGPADHIMAVAHKVEGLPKGKVLARAAELVATVDENYFELGGLLLRIRDDSLHEGYESFAQYVSDVFGFEERKAEYLMSIYKHLVHKAIPWDVVKSLGWSKLKELAPIITEATAKEWVEKAEKLSVTELKAMLKKGDGAGGKDPKTTSDVVNLKFKLHKDQSELVQNAIAKAKGEAGTEHDNEALAAMAGIYLGGNAGTITPAQKDPAELMKGWGLEATLAALEAAFPTLWLRAQEFETPEAAKAAMEAAAAEAEAQQKAAEPEGAAAQA